MSAFGTILSAIDARATSLAELARKIHANPELRFEERQASGWLADTVEQAGVAVERGVGGLPTALRARVGLAGGPRVAILAEYDALPEIGHVCGHNLIAGARWVPSSGSLRSRRTLAATSSSLERPARKAEAARSSCSRLRAPTRLPRHEEQHDACARVR